MFSSIFKSVKAQIRGEKEYPNIKGTVEFKDTKNGILVTAKIKGLPTKTNKCIGNFFGFHIHERN